MIDKKTSVPYDRARIAEFVAQELFSLGIFLHLNGYLYLREAITEVVCNGGEAYGITKILYPHIASAFGTSVCAVERAIRTAIKGIYKGSNMDKLKKISNIFTDEDLHFTNKEFILIIANQVEKELNLQH